MEARLCAFGVEVRDSKDPAGPTLQAHSGEWADLIAVAAKRLGR